jgi:hypothetical protein
MVWIQGRAEGKRNRERGARRTVSTSSASDTLTRMTTQRPRINPGPALAALVTALLLSACSSGNAKPTPSTTGSAGATAANTASSGSPAASATAVAVPQEYAALYQSLSTQLDGWQRTLDSQTAAPGAAAPVFGAHLVAANGNRGAALLDATTLPVVDGTLDRLKELGVGGVTLSVSFPLLNADYPRSADYLKFYETVAEHVRDRGLKLTVEQHIVFHGTLFSSVPFDFSTLPFDQFKAEFHAMAQLIIDHLHPDYLTLLSEPDTFVRLTGYQQAVGPANAASMIDTVVSGLQRGTTKVGAGAGSWLPNAADYDRAFAASSIDYLSLHVYPVGGDALTNGQAVVDTARAAGKPIVLDEAWLYKASPGEGPAMSFDQNVQVFRRDVYSFWAPLDARFLALLAQFVRVNDVAYVAPFWTTFFWGNVDYSAATKDLGYAQLTQQVNRAVLQALQGDTFSSTGNAWADAIRR